MSVIQKLIEKTENGEDCDLDLYLGNISLEQFIKDLKEFAEEKREEALREIPST